MQTVSRLAWIRVGALGDLLVALAALEESLRLYPNAKMTVIGPPLWLEILSPGHFANIDQILTVDRKGQKGELYENLAGRWTSQGPVSLQKILGRCEVVFNLRIDSARFIWPTIFAGASVRYGSAPWPFHLFFTHSAPWLGKDPVIHEREAALRVSLARPKKPMGRNETASIATDRFAYWQNRGGLPSTRMIDRGHAETLTGLPAGQYVLINPTSSRREKAWPSENFRSLAKALTQDFPLCIIGAPNETEWLHEVAAPLMTEGFRIRIAQPPSISDLTDVVGAARALITNTSSMQFIAATTATPTLTLMGRAKPKIPGPLGKSDLYLQGRIPSGFAGNIFEGEVAGFASLSAEEVERAARALLSGGPRNGPTDANSI